MTLVGPPRRRGAEASSTLAGVAVLVMSVATSGGLGLAPRILLPPAGQLYHGVYPGGVTGEEDDLTPADVASYEEAVGKQVAWVYFSHNWYHSRAFPLATAEWIRAGGSVPFVRLMLRSDPEQDHAEPTFTLARIIAGDFDSDLRAWADAARDFGSPLLVEYGTEVNGEWFPWNGKWNGGGRPDLYGDPTVSDGPERFRDAYRRIVDTCRGEGASNITWVYHVNAESWPQQSWNTPAAYYPGAAWVDWIAVSAYGAQTPLDDDWPVFRTLIDGAYPALTALDADKPIIVAEFGVTSGNRRGEPGPWADAALLDLIEGRWPRVMGFSWWNERWQNDGIASHDTDMRVQDNAALAAVFRAHVGGSASVLGRPSQSLPSRRPFRLLLRAAR